MTGKRANGEGSIYTYKNGYAAYVWITTPAGRRQRKYVYGKTREDVHEKWLKLHRESKRGPVASTVPNLATYLGEWHRDVVAPNLAPHTVENYEMFIRLYIGPDLGAKRVDRLTIRDVQQWLNALRVRCTCCAQRKDERRSEARRRCCAIGQCCRSLPSDWTIHQA
jgi:hypothetical protein